MVGPRPGAEARTRSRTLSKAAAWPGSSHSGAFVAAGELSHADRGRSHKQEKSGPLVATLDGNNPGKLAGKVTIQLSETTTYSYSF